MFNPSVQQSGVISWVKTGTGSAFVRAVAGSGKTTTLVHALAATTGHVAFMAFNKSAAKDIEKKVAQAIADGVIPDIRKRVKIGTVHSFGLAAVRRSCPAAEVDARRKRDITVEKFRQIDSPQGLDSFVLELVSLAKQRAIGLFGSIEDKSEWFDIVDHHDMAGDLEELPGVTVEQGVELAIRTLKFHNELFRQIKLIDFDDMIYLPVVTGMTPWQNDWVFGDEWQDANPARRALVRKMLKPTGRALFVGDERQAIYGFAGADNASIDNSIREFNCATLPLTITYRCPKAVVVEAQRIVSHIEAAETAPDGSVLSLDYADFIKAIKELRATDAILCRKTKPLVSLAYKLIRSGVACHVEGKEIGSGLIKLINRWRRARDLEQLQARLEDYAEREVQRLMAKGRETQAEALRDKVDTVLAIMEGASDLNDLRAKISAMFEDAENLPKMTLTLSTVHKAKGREWENVYILGRADFMPSAWARQAWEQEQEQNLIYVAVTRSQAMLAYVNGVPA